MKAQNKRLYTDVEFLTSVSPARNYQNLESLNKVANYITNEFGKLESTVIEQKWIADNNEYKNIIVKYNPEKKKRLIVGAHYDVCGNQPGADDNASAVAGLLETARLVFGNKPNLDYGIEQNQWAVMSTPNLYTTTILK